MNQQKYYQAPLPQGAIDEGQVILRDGRTAILRHVKREDKALLKAFIGRLSQETLHYRFFGETSSEFAL